MSAALPQVTMYSTAWCPYCLRAKHLLGRKGVAFQEVDVGEHPERREEMLARSSGRRTVPQIFIGERHIGGSDELHALERTGELDQLLGRA